MVDQLNGAKSLNTSVSSGSINYHKLSLEDGKHTFLSVHVVCGTQVIAFHI